MKRVLVTGMTSKQTNPRVFERETTVAFLLREALEACGYEVELRPARVDESFDEYDHVFVGLTPLHGLGSAHAYGALAAYLRCYQSNRATLYCDDPDTSKVVGGLKTVNKDIKKLTKPFFRYRKGYDVASSSEYRPWLESGVELLDEYSWPRLLLPLFPWANEYEVAKRVPQARESTIGVDLSAFVPRSVYSKLVTEPRQNVWVTEATYDDRWFVQQRPVLDVQFIDKKPIDTTLVKVYRQAWGILDAPVDSPGWWRTRPLYAAEAGAVYATRRQDVAKLGDAYAVLPDTIGTLTASARDELAEAQRTALIELLAPREWTIEQLRTIVEDPS